MPSMGGPGVFLSLCSVLSRWLTCSPQSHVQQTGESVGEPIRFQVCLTATRDRKTEASRAAFPGVSLLSPGVRRVARIDGLGTQGIELDAEATKVLLCGVMAWTQRRWS